MTPFRSEKDEVFSDWPSVGEVLADLRGSRTLTVLEVNPGDPRGRHVVGVVDDDHRYACDTVVLMVQWGRR